MRDVFLKAAAVAVGGAAASYAIVSTLVPLMGGELNGRMIALATLCPLILAFPTSFMNFRQEKKLLEVIDALSSAHDELAETHAKLAQAHARLAEKARHDTMTGLLNREAFLTALQEQRRKTDSGTLLIIDADHFKYVNDTHGHHNGDRALLRIADAIRDNVRQGDLVSRIGGEEFGAFIIGADWEEARIVAERIRLGVEAIHFSPDTGTYLPLSVSVGAALVRPGMAHGDLMREADRHLYEAKRRGRNRVVGEKSLPAAA